MSPPQPLAGAHCGAHPAVAAVEICSRCGTFLCGDCVEYFKDTTPCCAACLPLMRGGPISPRVVVTPFIGLAGLVTWLSGFLVPGRAGIALWVSSLPLGFACLALSVMELRLVRAGQSSPRGKPLAWAGFVVGVVYALLFALLVLGFALFTYRQLDRAG